MNYMHIGGGGCRSKILFETTIDKVYFRLSIHYLWKQNKGALYANILGLYGSSFYFLSFLTVLFWLYLVKHDLSSVCYCTYTFDKVREQHSHVYLFGLYIQK